MSSTTQPGNPPHLMLCPGCCTIDHIRAHPADPHALAPLAGCARCPFTFPILPGEYADLTLEAMHRHDCHAARDNKNYEGVAEAIIEHVRELGLDQGTLLARARHAAQSPETGQA